MSKKIENFVVGGVLKVTDEKTRGFGSGSVSQRYGSVDPYQNVKDPEHCLKEVRDQ
jgi:hypothetical protein